MRIAVKDITTIEEYERIFERYLNICNLAIKKNKDKFPYMEIWKVRWRGLGPDNTLQCAVYDNGPKIVYTLHLTEDMKIKIIEKTHATPEGIWLFEYSYLKHVVSNPQDFIKHPADLDWGRLTGVFGKVTAPRAHNPPREGHRQNSPSAPPSQLRRVCR